MKSKVIHALLFILWISSDLVAQTDTLILMPGNELVDGTAIVPYTNKWKVTFIDAEGKTTPNKIWTDYGQLIELDGKTYFHRVQDLYDPSMNLLDTWTNMLEHRTLIPVSFSSLNPSGGFSYYHFKGIRVTGCTNLNPENELKEINALLSEQVYDWNLYGMLLVGLPLKTGLMAKLPFYATQNNELDWLVIEVKNTETLPLPTGESLTTWKVATNQGLTFWVSKSAPYVIKLELALPDEAKLVWEVME